jgi:hypothetical protein
MMRVTKGQIDAASISVDPIRHRYYKEAQAHTKNLFIIGSKFGGMFAG